MTRRDPYPAVGAARRQAIDRACRLPLSDGDRRTLDATISLTAGYSRLTDAVYIADLTHITGLSERQQRDCLKRLAAHGLIVWQPRRGTNRDGQGFRSHLGLPPATETGTPGLPLSPPTKPAVHPRPNRQPCTAGDREETPRRTTRTPWGPPTRKQAEQIVEAFAAEFATHTETPLPTKTRRGYQRETERLLADGITPDAITAGLRRAIERHFLKPTALPELVAEAATKRKGHHHPNHHDFSDLAF